MNGNMPVSCFRASLCCLFGMFFCVANQVQAASLGSVEEDASFIRLYDGREPFEASVLSAIQDRLGFIWFGTFDGLVRYDGRQYKVWRQGDDPNSLSHNLIYALYEDAEGFLWIGAHNGLNRYDPRMDQFKRFAPESKELANTKVSALIGDDQGRIWIGAWRGLMMLDGESFTYFPHQPDGLDSPGKGVVFSLAFDNHGYLWIGAQSGLARYNLETGVFQRFQKGPLADKTIHALHLDKNGDVWAGGIGSGLFKLHTAEASSQLPDYTSYLPDPQNPHSIGSNAVYAIGEDVLGRIWVGTDGDGLFLLANPNLEGQARWRAFRENNHTGLPSDYVYSIFTDRSGLLWLGSFSGPAIYNPKSRLVGHFRQRPNSAGGLQHNGVWGIYEDSAGVIWVGTRGGLSRWDDDSGLFKTYRANSEDPNSLIHDEVYSLLEHENKLWVGTKGGVQLFENETFSPLPKTEGSDSLDGEVYSMAFDGFGSVWFVAAQGLFQYKTAQKWLKKRIYDPENQLGLANGGVTCLHRDQKGRFWVGTEAGLVRSLDEEQFQIMGTGVQSGLYSAYIVALQEDKEGRLLAGTSNGLDILRVDENMVGVEDRYSVDNGLSHNIIYGVLEDGAGLLWLSTGKGLNRLDPSTGEVRVFESRDGFMNKEYNQFAYFMDSKGVMYFGGEHGVDYFQPESLLSSTRHPKVVLLSVQQNYRDLSLEAAPPYAKNIQLPYQGNRVTFEFTAFEYLYENRNHFAYKLSGYDDGWVQAGQHHTANYSNLKPGNYDFQVKASGVDGTWGPGESLTRLTIPTPVFMTTWFRLFAVLLILLALAALYQWRVRLIKARKKALIALVDQRTRELQQEKERVETVRDFVKTVNSELDFIKLLRAILEKTESMLSAEVDEAKAVILDKPGRVFKVMARIPLDHWTKEEPMTPEEAEAAFISGAEEAWPGVFVKLGRDGGSSLALPLGTKGQVEGYIVYKNLKRKNAFDGPEIRVLADLCEPMVSALIRTQLLRQLQELNEKKNEFMSAMAHDLRSPLGGLLGFTELIKAELEDLPDISNQTKEDLALMQDTSRRILEMVNKLLDISAIEAGSVLLQMRHLEVGQLMSNVHRLFQPQARQKNIDFTLTPGPQLYIQADKSRLIEVLENLVSNAIKYTPIGGQANLFWEIEEGMVVFHVEDNGQGIAESQLKHLFTHYKTLGSKPTGGETSTGLGLAIARKLVELHGGRIWARARTGKGMVFSFSIPLQSRAGADEVASFGLLTEKPGLE